MTWCRVREVAGAKDQPRRPDSLNSLQDTGVRRWHAIIPKACTAPSAVSNNSSRQDDDHWREKGLLSHSAGMWSASSGSSPRRGRGGTSAGPPRTHGGHLNGGGCHASWPAPSVSLLCTAGGLPTWAKRRRMHSQVPDSRCALADWYQRELLLPFVRAETGTGNGGKGRGRGLVKHRLFREWDQALCAGQMRQPALGRRTEPRQSARYSGGSPATTSSLPVGRTCTAPPCHEIIT
jgi:hypothetical protein